ncbi:endolytic transglycosylase MltG [Mycetocola sp. JXN-3]|uniref:endolytic transglycosylase MltG n=1 Tax=Mycetocola sp. JXN-3 TaxID=2116510 RepID=UPI00210231D4|nr:endolytic transglycosylase MltG [Mycetocola sp. JXN-3]
MTDPQSGRFPERLTPGGSSGPVDPAGVAGPADEAVQRDAGVPEEAIVRGETSGPVGSPQPEEDVLNHVFSELTGELPRDVLEAHERALQEPDPVLPTPTSRREAREQAQIAETRAQRRAEAEAALAQHTEALRSTAKPKKRRRRGFVVAGISVLVVAALVGVGALTLGPVIPKLIERISSMEVKDFEGEGTGQITVTIADGDDGTAVARTLFKAGVTASVESFYQLLVGSSSEPVFHPGMYSLRKEMSAQAALNALLKPGNRLEGGLLIREGETGRTILPALAAAIGVPEADVQAAAATPANFGLPADAITMEGWLFPATYTFPKGTTATQALQTMVDRTKRALTEAGVPADQYERTLNVASIVQREARATDDFAKVSRVIENRLAAGMKLQMDSTAQYGKGQADGSVWSSAESLKDKNDWNTYERTGLPIGPISNPGDDAIKAAIAPADGDWLFFVTVNLTTGETVFTNNNADHEAAVKQLRDWCSANPGKGC